MHAKKVNFQRGDEAGDPEAISCYAELLIRNLSQSPGSGASPTMALAKVAADDAIHPGIAHE